jgi:hypothetical protein
MVANIEWTDDDGSESSEHVGAADFSNSNYYYNNNNTTSNNYGRRVSLRQVKDDPANDIAKSESLAVIRIRFIVVMVLLLSTVTVSVVVYLFTSEAEIRDFEQQFYDNSAKVLEALGSALDRTRGAADAFSVVLVSYATNANATWPFVTHPQFAVHAAKAQGLSRSANLVVYPFVENSQRREWEAYSMQHQGWVDTMIALQKKDPNFRGTIVQNWTALGLIHNSSGPLTTPGPFLPTWQSYPVVPVFPPFNWDLLASSNMEESVSTAMRSKEVVIGKTINLVRLKTHE